jgi:phosphoglycolate phosphatase-like HAD superfamily hydrolase
MMAAAVILDVDGTLVDSNDAHANAWVEAFAVHGITGAFAAARRAIGMGGDKVIPSVAGMDAESALGKAIAETRGQIFKDKYLPAIRPFNGARDLVRRFADDGYALAVASSAQKDELVPLLEIAGVADLIDSQTSADDADRSKPDPDIVAAALKRVKAAPDEAIMLGDTPYDVEAATRAGVRIVALECGGWCRDELRGAVEVYADPADLLNKYDTSIFARERPR